jgi:hypothetical protein
MKLCASIKVCAWLTVNRFEIATFANLQTVKAQYSDPIPPIFEPSDELQ